MSGKGFTHESTINESIEWYTPPEIFEALNVEFDLDPCSPGVGKTFVPAKQHLTIVDNGLTADWGDAFVFVNPPYGKHTGEWMKKLNHHGNGIALVFARTDVKWFHDIADTVNAVLFVQSRIRFYQGSKTVRGGSPGTGSMMLAFGNKAVKVLQESNLGVVMKPFITEKIV